MRKLLVIAAREYLAAVRTKTFIVSLVILPVMMGGSILVQMLVQGIVDTADKRFILVKHAGVADGLVKEIERKLDEHNKTKTMADGRQIKPYLKIAEVLPAASPDQLDEQRYTLSEQVKSGKIMGFMEIIRNAEKAPPGKESPAAHYGLYKLRYQSNRPTYFEFSKFVERIVAEQVREEVARQSRLSATQLTELLNPVTLESKGLSKRDASGKVQDASREGQFAPIIVPIIMMMLMFMVVMMTATPLMQSVVEEKMQRIAEVLLGSVKPFQLMMGKLLGMMAVSLTIAAVYLAGAYWAAWHFGFSEYIPLQLLLWFLVFQTLGEFMFGSLFIAVGAACTDMKETQNLVLPIMLLVCFPLFLLGNVVQDPRSPVVQIVSFFPFATPNLMIARLAIPPGIPWWEPVVGVIIVLVSTIVCVYAAGRIFRVGILMQGKGARIGEMLKWIVRG